MHHIIDFSSFRSVNNGIALHLALVVGTMLMSGLVIGYVSKFLFLWVPSRARRQIAGAFGAIGVLAGLWLGIIFFDH